MTIVAEVEVEEAEVITVESLRKQFEDFEDATQTARTFSEVVRDHRDLRPWTGEQLAEFARRKQQPTVVPRIAAKVDFLVGLERQQRSNPKAYPRTEKHVDAADAATDALVYVSENTDFDQVSSSVFETAMLVEGYAGAIIEPVMRRGQVEIDIVYVPFDRCYFDPYSRDRYFRDATYKGFVIWLDVEQAKSIYPSKADELDQVMSDYEQTGTFEDTPKWIDSRRKRIKVCQHYCLKGGVWYSSHFTDKLFLMEPQPCPLLDEYDEPQCPIELVHGYIDRRGNRYSLGHSLVGLESEINHRHSKYLHAASTKQVHYEKGALSDPRKIADQLKKADGAVEFPAGSLSEGRVQIHTNGEMALGQLQLLQETKQELDARGASQLNLNEAAAMSGRALRTIDANRKMELGPLLDAHRTWKRRVYRQVWNRIRQFWDEERWIRVTDDEDNLKWVGLNQPMTVGDLLMEKAEKGDQQAQAMLQQMVATQDPRLNQVYETRNDVAEMDIDIIIDEAPDSLSVQQEQFEVMTELAKVYGPQEVPFELILQLSSLRNKDEIIEKLKGDEQAQAMQAQMAAMQQQMAEIMHQMEMADKQADIENKQAKTQNLIADTASKMASIDKTESETEQNRLENVMVASFPDIRPNVSI